MKIGKRWFFVITDAKLAKKIEAVIKGTAFVHKQRRAKPIPFTEEWKETAYNIQENMREVTDAEHHDL